MGEGESKQNLTTKFAKPSTHTKVAFDGTRFPIDLANDAVYNHALSNHNPRFIFGGPQ